MLAPDWNWRGEASVVKLIVHNYFDKAVEAFARARAMAPLRGWSGGKVGHTNGYEAAQVDLDRQLCYYCYRADVQTRQRPAKVAMSDELESGRLPTGGPGDDSDFNPDSNPNSNRRRAEVSTRQRPV